LQTSPSIGTTRHFDATVSGRFTPPPELETIARSLQDDVVLTYFYNSKDDYAYGAKQVLEVVARRHPHLTVRVLDLDTELVAAREYHVKLYNTSLSRRRAAALRSRTRWICRQMAYAIERVLQRRVQTVCFITGHGELTRQATCISVTWRPWVLTGRALRTYWKRRQTRSIGLSWQSRPSATGIARSRRRCSRRSPRTARSLPTSGPPAPTHTAEVQVLRDYLVRGGNVLLAYDPRFPVTRELSSLLDEVGLAVEDGWWSIR